MSQLKILLIFFLISNITAQEAKIDFKRMTLTGKYQKPNVPEWSHNAVFYQVYPQTFYDSNADGIGDLKGIMEKLDYIKSLGVDAIWLSPFYESPFRDAGYDVSDYYSVAARYGTNEDAKNLFQKAHDLGMRVIIDYVPGHTSIDHPWFIASSQPESNKYSNWYIWTNGTWFKNQNKYRQGFIQGYSERDGNYLSNFFWHQPALNYGYGNPDPEQPWQLPVDHPDIMALKEEMKNVLKFWLDMGCDGFRVDMAGSLVKNDLNNECSIYWQSVSNWVKEHYPEAFLVSEWSNPKLAIEGGFHCDFMHWFEGYNNLFHNGDKSFFDTSGNGDIYNFLKIYFNQLTATRHKGYISVPFANHDLPRIKSNNRTDKDIELIYAFMLTMPGIPFLYYGDEIGMRQLKDLPYIEGSYGTRAGARTPMQWSSGLNKGFSFASPEKLWQQVDNDLNAPDVETMENDKHSLLNQVRKLIEIKKNNKALSAYSEFIPIYVEPNTYPFVYLRALDDSHLLVVLNPSSEDAKISFNMENNGYDPRLLIGNDAEIELKGNKANLKIKGASYVIYRLK